MGDLPLFNADTELRVTISEILMIMMTADPDCRQLGLSSHLSHTASVALMMLTMPSKIRSTLSSTSCVGLPERVLWHDLILIQYSDRSIMVFIRIRIARPILFRNQHAGYDYPRLLSCRTVGVARIFLVLLALALLCYLSHSTVLRALASKVAGVGIMAGGQVLLLPVAQFLIIYVYLEWRFAAEVYLVLVDN